MRNVTISTQPNGNPDRTEIRANYLAGRSVFIATLPTGDNASLGKADSKFQKAADKIRVSQGPMGLKIQTGLSSKMYHPTDFAEISNHIAGTVKRLAKTPA